MATLRWASFVLGLLTIIVASIVENQSNCFFHPADIMDPWLAIGFFISIIFILSIILPICLEGSVFLYMYVPVYVFRIKALLQVFLDPQGIMDLSGDNPKDMVIFRTWSGNVYRGRPKSFFLIADLYLAGVEKRVGKNDWRMSEKDNFLQFSITWMKKVPNKQNELQVV